MCEKKRTKKRRENAVKSEAKIYKKKNLKQIRRRNRRMEGAVKRKKSKVAKRKKERLEDDKEEGRRVVARAAETSNRRPRGERDLKTTSAADEFLFISNTDHKQEPRLSPLDLPSSPLVSPHRNTSWLYPSFTSHTHTYI